MNKAKLVLIALSVIAISANSALSAVSITFDDGLGDPTSVTISPGDSFSFSLKLTSTSELVTGISYFFQSSDPSGKFSIAARDISGSPYTFLFIANSTIFSGSNATLDPINNNDLGAGVDDVFSPTGVGTFLIANYTISSNATIAPGNYTLSLIGTDVADQDGEPVLHSTNTYNITVIPEPGVGMLLGVAGLAGVVLRRRRGF